MLKLDLRPDGLYRYQPVTDAAWGRGVGFAAIGLALTLTDARGGAMANLFAAELMFMTCGMPGQAGTL
jgi:hypothetical protein